MAILQILVCTILTPKGSCQRHSKIAEAQNLEKVFQYNIEMLYILTFHVLSMFSAKKKQFCARFCMFWGTFQAISRPEQLKFKTPGFPGFQVLLGTLQYICGQNVEINRIIQY